MPRPTTPIIKPVENYSAVLDPELLTRSVNVQTNVAADPTLFPNPPVDLKELKANNDDFAQLIVQAADGSKTVIAQKNKQRNLIIKDLRLLARYVEKVSDGDIAIFKASGFAPLPNTRTPQVALSPSFRSIDRGLISGQMEIKLKGNPDALSYELGYTKMANGQPGPWTTQLVTGVRSPVILNGLTPGATYAFQARFMSKSGYSDWSDYVTCMCV